MSFTKKVLVTGGAGFIGSHTVVALAQAGYQPLILDNYSNSNPQVITSIEEIIGKKVDHITGDCCDTNLMHAIFKEEAISGIIHFAASKAVGESVEHPLLYYRNNLNSLLVILEMAKEFSTPHLVFSSSCTIYGQPEVIPVTEDTPPQPAVSPYGNTKKICEDIIKDAVISKLGLKAISLRYFNPIGAHPSAKIGELPLGTPSNLVPFITQTAAGLREKLTVFGNDYHTVDGTCVRDYIHVMDLSEAHVAALQYLEQQDAKDFYDIFNLGTGTGSTVMQIINAFKEVSGVDLRYEIGPRREGDVEKIFANVDKASRVLNWKATQSIEQALKHAWQWQQALLIKK